MSSKELLMPRIIHQAWGLGDKRDALCPEAMVWREQWKQLCPGWEHRCYDRKDVFKLVPPMPEAIQDVYYRSSNTGHRADVLRLWLVYSVGGIWADADMEPRKNIEPMMRGVLLFFPGIKPAWTDLGEQLIEFCIMGGVPGHPFLAYLLQQLPGWVEKHWDASPPVRTGPQFVEWHLKRWVQQQHPDDITIFHPKVFCPYSWHEKHRAGGVFRSSVAIHRWWGSWLF